MHWLSRIVSWVICVLVIVASVGLTAALWYAYYNIRYKSGINTQYSLLEEFVRNQQAVLTLAVLATITMVRFQGDGYCVVSHWNLFSDHPRSGHLFFEKQVVWVVRSFRGGGTVYDESARTFNCSAAGFSCTCGLFELLGRGGDMPGHSKLSRPESYCSLRQHSSSKAALARQCRFRCQQL